MKHIIVAFVESALAHEALPDLITLGVDPKRIVVIEPGTSRRALFERMREASVPYNQAGIYAELSRRGGAIVIVRADDASATAVDKVLDGRGTVDLDDAAEHWRAAGWTANRHQPARRS